MKECGTRRKYKLIIRILNKKTGNNELDSKENNDLTEKHVTNKYLTMRSSFSLRTRRQ